MQHQFKVDQVDQTLMQSLDANHATAYFAAMVFQLGCSIGELIGMGVPPEQLLESVLQLVEKAVKTRLSVDTKETSHDK